MAKTYDGGIVSAYGAAVRGGYTGTYEQFCAEQAQFGANAAAVAAAKTAVDSAKSQVDQTVNTFTQTTVPNAVSSVQSAGTEQIGLVQNAGAAQTQAVEAAGAQQVSGVQTEGSSQIHDIEQVALSAIGQINDAEDSSVAAVEAAETSAAEAVSSAQAAAVQAVQTESSTQQAAVQAKGEQIIASIPADYTALSDNVSNLKSALNGGTFTFTKTYMSDNRYSTNVLYTAQESNVGKSLQQIATGSTTGGFSCMIDIKHSSQVTFPVWASTSAFGFLAFDENDICVWAKSYTSSEATLGQEITVVFPSNAVKFLFTAVKSLNDLGTEYTVTVTKQPITEELNKLVIDGDQHNLFSIYNAFKGYLTTTGAFTTDQGKTNRTTDFISVESNKHITIQTWMTVPSDTAHWQCVCFYDESKTLIGTRKVKTGSTNDHETFTVEVPSNAVYFRAASRVYNDWKIMLQYGDVPSAFEYNYADIEYIKGEIDGHLNTIVRYSDDTYVKSINHRGWYECPENTLPAFIQSKKHGYNYVETDIRFTADGTPVLMHDATINRTCCNASDGSAITETVNIADLHDSELSNYDACTPSAWSEWAGTKIPTFAEFIDLCRKLGLKMYIEIKAGDQDKISSLVSMVKGNGSIKNASWICAAVANIQYLQNTDNALRIGLVTNIVDSVIIQTVNSIKAANEGEVFIDSSSYGSEQVTLCSDAEIPLEAWTVDTQTAVLALNNYVTGITTNRVIASSILYDSVIE